MEPTQINVQRLIPISESLSIVQQGSDASLYVEFKWEPVENKKKSLEAGRPIFEDKPYIKIVVPGDKTKQWYRPVRMVSNGIEPPDTQRWPNQWNAFINQQKQVMEGTPLTEWPSITRSEAESLKALNIHTVEQLAALSDHALTAMGMRQFRDKAKAYLEKSKDGVSAGKWAAEKENLQAQIEALQNQLNGFKDSGIIPKQEASAPPKKRGPKKKVKDEQDIPPTGSAGG